MPCPAFVDLVGASGGAGVPDFGLGPAFLCWSLELSGFVEQSLDFGQDVGDYISDTSLVEFLVNLDVASFLGLGGIGVGPVQTPCQESILLRLEFET